MTDFKSAPLFRLMKWGEKSGKEWQGQGKAWQIDTVEHMHVGGVSDKG